MLTAVAAARAGELDHFELQMRSDAEERALHGEARGEPSAAVGQQMRVQANA